MKRRCSFGFGFILVVSCCGNDVYAKVEEFSNDAIRETVLIRQEIPNSIHMLYKASMDSLLVYKVYIDGREIVPAEQVMMTDEYLPWPVIKKEEDTITIRLDIWKREYKGKYEWHLLIRDRKGISSYDAYIFDDASKDLKLDYGIIFPDGTIIGPFKMKVQLKF